MRTQEAAVYFEMQIRIARSCPGQEDIKPSQPCQIVESKEISIA